MNVFLLEVKKVTQHRFPIRVVGIIALLLIPSIATAQLLTSDELAGRSKVATAIGGQLLSGNPPMTGLASASVSIVEFADFECTFCKQMSQLLEIQLLPTEKDKVRIVYRYLPLPQHPWARPAAEMASCVELQDNATFWKLHDFLYANQDRFNAASLRQEITRFLSTQSGADMRLFDDCVDNHATAKAVENDLQMAADLGVFSTPTLFVNGERLHDVHELRQLEDAVNAALKGQVPKK